MLLNTGDLSSFKASGLKFVEGMQAISFYKRESFCHSCPSPEVYRVPSPLFRRRASLWKCPSDCSSTCLWRLYQESRKAAYLHSDLPSPHPSTFLSPSPCSWCCLDLISRKFTKTPLSAAVISRTVAWKVCLCDPVFVSAGRRGRSPMWWCPWSGLRRYVYHRHVIPGPNLAL